MASNNNSNEAGGLALVLAFIGAMAIMFAVVLAFFAFVLTIIAIFAWNSPLRLGKWVVTPEEARAFVGRGIVGAIMVPAFCLFCEVVFQVPIVWDYLAYMMVGGYTLGSLGIAIMIAEDEAPSAPVTYIPPQPQLPPAPRPVLSAPKEPFRFASWNDEEGR